MKALPRPFFQRDVHDVARDLIGCSLLWGGCGGIIVETEAYAAADDPACHLFTRRSTREFMAKHLAGTAYVYLNYGMYWLVNVTVKAGGNAAMDGIVLIRALEPTAGIAEMRARRKREALRDLCSGPGKLGVALGMDRDQHGADLIEAAERGEGGIFSPGAKANPPEIEADVRVGISDGADLPYRYLLKGSAFVSVKPGRAAATARPPRRRKSAPSE